MSPPQPDSELPLFPLRTVLFPGGVLPLQIFEPRYLDLVGRCERSGQPFGVVSLRQGEEVQRAGDVAPETFEPVGTLAHIRGLSRPQPGLIHLRCEGGRRFRLGAARRLPHGLWVAPVAHWLADDPAVPVPAHLAHVARALQTLLAQAEAGRAPPLPLAPPWHWDDAGWLANRWCELLGLPPAQRQSLMALDNPLLRLELVADRLERDHGLAPPETPAGGPSG